ncbi:alanine racemase [Marinoscillum furvescens]|uniref:Alanine racemase n=1 Tax=Marinoscillum furvescens DSM 4134 TaxID=1122208 RepID=A0A3D9L0F5_MARFU|nr:alanine racemase [Marinoscillum furvescens]RED96224.1 alanine racemase [Marinoscillum furvescens DSM 4134]
MFATSEIELDQSALAQNLKFIRSIIGNDVRLSSVVKGNAYGHGIFEFVPMAEAQGVDHFSVFSADEALEVTNISLNKSSVMIMGYVGPDELEWAVLNDVEFFVFEMGRLKQAYEIAKKFDTRARIHIEFETGLHRTGFSKSELNQLVSFIQDKKDYFEVLGDCTHYAGAESIANYLRIKNQIKKFNKMDRWIRNQGITPKFKHTACSAAAISYPKSRMDMVRIGILQYGFWPSKETFIDCIKHSESREDPLRRVIKWKSRVMAVKEVDTGEFIGYGTTFMATENMKIATVPVGYSHGYSRSLSNQGRVLIHGKRLAVVGIVNMNLLIVDVSECPEAAPGDEVVLIGEQGDVAVSVASFSELSDQLNYELLTRLPRNIPRTVVKN